MMVVAFCLLLTAGMTISVVRSVRRPIFDLVGALRHCRSGEHQFVVPHTELDNEIAKALRWFQDMAGQQALTMAALDGFSTMLMITDPDEKVVFMSGALVDQFMKFEPSFRAVRHDFSIEKMVGQHVDWYCAELQIRRELLHDDSKTRKVRMSVDGQTTIVDMSSISASDGSRVGHTLLWHNMTAELEAETEVGAVVSATVRGDFSRRLSLDGKTGFVREIASGLNSVSQNIERAVDDFTEVLGAVSSGDLTRSVDGDYEGKPAPSRPPSRPPSPACRRPWSPSRPLRSMSAPPPARSTPAPTTCRAARRSRRRPSKRRRPPPRNSPHPLRPRPRRPAMRSTSSEQANGIDEMTQAVAHMDEMMQQNAVLAEESAAPAGASAARSSGSTSWSRCSGPARAASRRPAAATPTGCAASPRKALPTSRAAAGPEAQHLTIRTGAACRAGLRFRVRGPGSRISR